MQIKNRSIERNCCRSNAGQANNQQFIDSISTADVRIYFGMTSTGLVDQCKSTFRPPIESSQNFSGFHGSYKGQYVETRTFRYQWLLETKYETISDIRQCVRLCGKNEQCQEQCLSDLSIKFFSSLRIRGKCYPDLCSAAGLIHSENLKVVIKFSNGRIDITCVLVDSTCECIS